MDVHKKHVYFYITNKNVALAKYRFAKLPEPL